MTALSSMIPISVKVETVATAARQADFASAESFLIVEVVDRDRGELLTYRARMTDDVPVIEDAMSDQMARAESIAWAW